MLRVLPQTRPPGAQPVTNFEESRVRHLEDKRRQRKTGQVNTLLPLTFSVTCVDEPRLQDRAVLR